MIASGAPLLELGMESHRSAERAVAGYFRYLRRDCWQVAQARVANPVVYWRLRRGVWVD